MLTLTFALVTPPFILDAHSALFHGAANVGLLNVKNGTAGGGVGDGPPGGGVGVEVGPPGGGVGVAVGPPGGGVGVFTGDVGIVTSRGGL